MKRNVSWGKEILHNVLKLVEALLMLADEQVQLNDLEAVQAIWEASATKLKITGKTKCQTKGGKPTVKSGTTKEALLQLVQVAGFELKLSKRKPSSGTPDLKEEIQKVLDCLRELEELFKDDRPNHTVRTAYWQFTLTLKHQTASTEENLAEIKRKWREKNPEETSPEPAPHDSIDWHQVCHAMLNKYPLRIPATDRYRGYEAKIDHVPLGLVKPSRQAKGDEVDSLIAAEGTQQYQLLEKEIERQFEKSEFFREVIDKNGKNLAIIGEPGAGKSTWMDCIARHLDREGDPHGFPICIPLGNLQGKTLEEYLRQIWLKAALPDLDAGAVEVKPALEAKLVQLFNSGKVWLLLDGADEMRVAGSNSPLKEIANQLIGWVAKARVAISCRLNVWETNDKALFNFETYRTLDFDQAGVADFIEQWFTEAGKPQLGERLQAKLAEPEKDRIRDLIKNPLRLSLLCETWDDREDLPETKAGLYQRFREDFYNWKKDEFPTSWTQQQELNARLAKLALAAWERKMPLRKLLCYEVMGEDWFNLAQDLGWLNLVDRNGETNEPIYAFYHLTFQEYFAALAVGDWHYFLTHVPNDPKQGIYRIFESQWKEVILLWLGRLDVPGEQKEEFVTSLVEFEDGCGEWDASDTETKGFYEFQAYFLASAGIAEFKESSQINNQIINKISSWIFFNFNSAKKEYITSIYIVNVEVWKLIQKTNREKAIILLLNLLTNPDAKHLSVSIVGCLKLIAPRNQKAIDILTDLLSKDFDALSRLQIAWCLGYIDNNNSLAVKTIINLMDIIDDEATQLFFGELLRDITPDNEEIINIFNSLLESTQNEYAQWKIAENLEKFDPGNQRAIETFIFLFNQTKDKSIRRKLEVSLQRSAVDNQEAINKLIDLFIDTKDRNIRWELARCLSNIAIDNHEAINQISSLLPEDYFLIKEEVIWCLGNIAISNQKVIKLFEDLLDKDVNFPAIKEKIAKSLVKIDPGNAKAIDTLIVLLDKTEDYSLQQVVLRCLGNSAVGHKKAIASLVALLAKTKDWYTRWQVAWSLGKADPGNRTALEELVALTKTESRLSHTEVVVSLGEVGTGNSDVISALVQLIGNSQDEWIRWQAADSLKKILTTEQQMAGVVSALKDFLSNETYENNFDRFENCYKLIWHCAQILPYPVFYEAWHHPPHTPHPEVEGTTGVGFSAGILQRNLAELPQLLNAALVDTELIDSVQLICIDGSNFFDKDNPILEIYDAMLDSRCPKCSDGSPKKMAELKVYYKSLGRDSEKRPILLFYENPTGAPPQGFSEIFLNALSKFDGGICVVSDQANIPLQSFSPNQPNLIEDIVGWIRRIVIES